MKTTINLLLILVASLALDGCILEVTEFDNFDVNKDISLDIEYPDRIKYDDFFDVKFKITNNLEKSDIILTKIKACDTFGTLWFENTDNMCWISPDILIGPKETKEIIKRVRITDVARNNFFREIIDNVKGQLGLQFLIKYAGETKVGEIKRNFGVYLHE